jgi:hypothetical protein
MLPSTTIDGCIQSAFARLLRCSWSKDTFSAQLLRLLDIFKDKGYEQNRVERNWISQVKKLSKDLEKSAFQAIRELGLCMIRNSSVDLIGSGVAASVLPCDSIPVRQTTLD